MWFQHKREVEMFRQFYITFIFFFSFTILNYNLIAQTQRNPVIEFCTGTWCQWCPCGDWTVENLLSAHPNLIPLAYHGPVGSDPFANFTGNEIISLMGFTGYPTATVDRSSTLGDYTTWISKVNSRINISATVSINIQKSFNKTTGQLDAAINVTALQNLTGQFKYNIILTEDSLIYNQVNNGACTSGGTNWVHYWVVRSMLNGSSGENLNSGSSWNTGDMISKNISTVISSGYNWQKCKLIVLVYKQNTPMYLAEIQQGESYPLLNEITVASPNGGEEWAAENNYDITWTSDFSQNVKIELYRSGLFNSVISASTPNTGLYTWTVPSSIIQGADYKIKIYNVNDSTIYDFSNQSFSIFPPTFQLSVVINNGWNLVSVPGINSNGQGVDMWWNDRIGDVFGYGNGYYAVTSTLPTQGYCLKQSGVETYSTGDQWPAVGIIKVPHFSITINGWGLIGVFECPVAVSELTTIPPGLLVGPVYGYASGYQVVDTLYPGYGYWIKLFGQLVLPPCDGATHLSMVTELIKKDWGKIILTDKTGKSFTLYSANEETDLTRFEMPPLPPEGVFDIRYGSGKMVENINNGYQLIEMRGVEYPVTIRAEGINIRIKDLTGSGINKEIKTGQEITLKDKLIDKLLVTGDIMPVKYSLEQNYPNPFNPVTTIKFSLPHTVNNASVTIYNALGQKISELVNNPLSAGSYEYRWNAQDYASGIYIYELKTNDFISVKKMILLK
jgi:Outer membrane protein Omp28/Secretion system C-terminal sorting domain/Kre9/KNH-like N-terminal Ig-like domain